MFQLFRTGDPVSSIGRPAVEIDQLLSELGRLYVQRLRAVQLNRGIEIQAINSKILALKSRLKQI